MLTQADPVGNVTRYEYDAEEHVVAATDPRGNITASRYDALSRLDRITDAAGASLHHKQPGDDAPYLLLH